MEILLYIIFLLFIVCFYNTIIFLKHCCIRERNNNRLHNMDRLNNINMDRFHNVINSYEMLEEENIICPITQETILLGDNIEELPCGHKFSDSIYKWVKIKNECPVCRENIIENIL